MKHPQTAGHESLPDSHQDVYSKTLFGFWVYLLTDFVFFSALFATYIVLHSGTYGGPTSRELFHLPCTLAQTLLLLVSSFTIGLGGVAAHRGNKKWTILLFGISFLLGLIFMGMQFGEFFRLINAGNSWERSAFLSAFFTLVGTHMLHVVFALLWVIVLIIPVCLQGITEVSLRRLICLKMFWQFINVVWIFIFSIVYLLGGSY